LHVEQLERDHAHGMCQLFHHDTQLMALSHHTLRNNMKPHLFNATHSLRAHASQE
jgi:hypothetical protein